MSPTNPKTPPKPAVKPEWLAIGTRLAGLLETAKSTQAALAEAVGIDQGSMSKVIQGKRGLSPHQLAAAGKHLGVGVGALLDDSATALAPGLPASEAIAAYLQKHQLDLSPREQNVLEGLRNRLGTSARVSETDVANLLRIVREVYLSGNS